MANTCLDIQRLARLVRNKRGRRSLREVSEEIGISFATLSRVENYHFPDMETFIALSNWLEVHPGDLFLTTQQRQEQQQRATDEEIINLLMCDKHINPESAYILGRIIKAAYRDLSDD